MILVSVKSAGGSGGRTERGRRCPPPADCRWPEPLGPFSRGLGAADVGVALATDDRRRGTSDWPTTVWALRKGRPGAQITPHDLRRAYVKWLELAKIPRTRRRLYTAMAPGTSPTSTKRTRSRSSCSRTRRRSGPISARLPRNLPRLRSRNNLSRSCNCLCHNVLGRQDSNLQHPD